MGGSVSRNFTSNEELVICILHYVLHIKKFQITNTKLQINSKYEIQNPKHF